MAASIVRLGASKREPCRAEHRYDRLPFVVSGARVGRRFWVPPVTGNYGVDCVLGEHYAECALPLLREPQSKEFPGGRQLLRHIVLDMLRHGDDERDRGLIVGFMGRIGAELEGADGATPPKPGQWGRT